MNEYMVMGYKINIVGIIAEINDPPRTIKLIHDLSSKCKNENCSIQLLHGRGIAGRKHLLQAISQALKAFDRDENISKDIGLEICVRASFRRQISRALNILGIEKGKIPICAVFIDCDSEVIEEIGEILGKRDDKVFQADVNALKDIYKIKDNEINASGNIERVMIERSALLSLEI